MENFLPEPTKSLENPDSPRLTLRILSVVGDRDPYFLSSGLGTKGKGWRTNKALTFCFQHVGLQKPQDGRGRFMVEKGPWESA